MTQRIRLWPEEHRVKDDQVEVAAVVEGVRGKPTSLFFRLPLAQQSIITSAADPFVLAVVFHALRVGADVEVHGTVSPSLLRGLEEFQAAWCRWRPDTYRPFGVRADLEEEAVREGGGRAAMTFSGGLDSSHTAWRHTRSELGRRKRRIGAAVLVHGFDIPLDHDDVFARAVASARAILDSVEIPLIPIACNARALKDDWEDSHGAALAACLHLLAGGYSAGLIASSSVYDCLRLPWGSNPVTDPLLCSAAFTIVHDGCELTRWEKADEIGDWDEANRNLRVCWEGEHLDRNCGHCMRCVGTAVSYAAVERSIPPSIPIDSPGEAVARLRSLHPNPIQLGHYQNMASTARSRGLTDPWIDELTRLVNGRRSIEPGRPFDWWVALRHRFRRRPTNDPSGAIEPEV